MENSLLELKEFFSSAEKTVSGLNSTISKLKLSLNDEDKKKLEDKLTEMDFTNIQNEMVKTQSILSDLMTKV